MKNKISVMMAMLVISIMLSGIAAHGQGNIPGGSNGTDNKTIENENIAIQITGGENVPKFSFWAPGENNTVYRVQFKTMFEIVDSNDNGQYDTDEDNKVPQSNQALAAWNWDFSSTEQNDGETEFNITGDGSLAPVMGNFDLKFVNHLGDNSESFKFDVIVGNYDFVSDADNAMLVLGFSLTAADGSDDIEDTGDTVEFGDAFMQIEETASTDDGDIGVGMTTPSNNSAIAYIAYERFNGGFLHDPTVGFDSTGLLPINYTSIFLALVVAVPIAIKLRKKE